MVHALYLGINGSLDIVSKVLKMRNEKDAAGKNLIKYFSMPCKPTKINGGRTHNLPEHAPDKWLQFKEYCRQDVKVEREIRQKVMINYEIPEKEKALWRLDQEINNRGIKVDPQLIENAIDCNTWMNEKLLKRAKEITHLENPNSGIQAKQWLKTYEGKQFDSITKENIEEVISAVEKPECKEFLNIYQEMSKTSIAKYETMTSCKCEDNRIRGLFQFYGASRTGRWAGRLVQVHNLPRNNLPDIETAREFLLAGDYGSLEILYPSVANVLSELIRTAFVPAPSYKFVVSDFSAIEARIIAWLAGERWRMDVFNGDGKIYEASASQMFRVPIETVTKDSPLRQKGKISELALGYGGSTGALISMGALKMGLTEEELPDLVSLWRSANPKIVQLWRMAREAAGTAIKEKTTEKFRYKITFSYNRGHMYIKLPSGRELCYLFADTETNFKGYQVITYMGTNQTTRTFEKLETYGAKLVENIVQAIARDCLAEAMLRIDEAGYRIVLHVHDEIVVEVPDGQDCLNEINSILGVPLSWAPGLPLKGDGFECKYYRKD